MGDRKHEGVPRNGRQKDGVAASVRRGCGVSESRGSDRGSHTCALSSVTHNSPEREAAQTPTDRCVNKPKAAETYSEILLSLKKEGGSGTGCSIDEPQRHHAQ